MAIPPPKPPPGAVKREWGVPDAPPPEGPVPPQRQNIEFPTIQSGLSPEMARLAESVKNFRSMYTNRPSLGEGSLRALADMYPLADSLMNRLSAEIQQDPDYKAARSGSIEDATAAQRGKARVYDKLLSDVMDLRGRALTARQEVATMPTVAEGREEMLVTADRPDPADVQAKKEADALAGSGMVSVADPAPPRPEFMKEGVRLREAARQKGEYPPNEKPLTDAEMMAKYGKPKAEAKPAPRTSQEAAPETVDPLGTSEQPEELGESPQPEEELGESQQPKLAARTSEEAAPEPTPKETEAGTDAKIEEEADAAEAKTQAAKAEADEDLPEWVKELGEDDETLNAYQQAQKARRAAVEKALGESPTPERLELGESPTPERLEEEELGESPSWFGEGQLKKLPLPADEPPGELKTLPQESYAPPVDAAEEAELGESPTPERLEEEEFGESPQDWMDDFGESPTERVFDAYPDIPESIRRPDTSAEPAWMGMSDDALKAGSGIVSTPDARKAAVAKAMRPQKIRAPEGSRVIRGDGGWAYAVLPNKDIKIIGAPKGHRPGALLKAGSDGYWSAIANKFGIDTVPEVSMKGIEPDEPLTPEKGTRKKGVGKALTRLLSEGINMPEKLPTD
tara:strand:- start:351 stop:2231 length:1881 start_codon:yes stop_codon:yes gene_type:complete